MQTLNMTKHAYIVKQKYADRYNNMMKVHTAAAPIQNG